MTHRPLHALEITDRGPWDPDPRQRRFPVRARCICGGASWVYTEEARATEQLDAWPLMLAALEDDFDRHLRSVEARRANRPDPSFF